MAAGDFTASELVDVIAKADQVWADNKVKPDYEANVEVVRAIQQEQTARLIPVTDSNKDYDLKVIWIKAGSTTTTAGTDDCTIGGDELESDSENYTISQTRHFGRNVKEKLFRNNNFDMSEVIAKIMLEADKVLSEYIASYVVAQIDANAGTNEYFTATLGTIHTDGHTYIPTSGNWTANLIPHLMLSGMRNRFANPYMLSGVNLYVENWQKMLEAANADGKGDAAKFNAIRKYFDVFNIDTALSPELATFMIDRGALAFSTKNYHPSTPQVYKDHDRFSFASRNIPGLIIDVVYTNECSSNEVTHKFSYYAHYDLFLNPTGKTATRTGVLKFVNGAVPS